MPPRLPFPILLKYSALPFNYGRWQINTPKLCPQGQDSLQKLLIFDDQDFIVVRLEIDEVIDCRSFEI